MPSPNIKLPPTSILNLNCNECVHLITDLHLLHTEQVDSLQAWTETFHPTDHLIIMGDLFEVWYENHWGAHPPYFKLFSLLNALKKKIRSMHLIIGNREVLAGPILRKKAGLNLHWGPLLLSAPSGSLLVMHGDELVPQDRKYQQFRKVLRSNFTKMIIRLLPGPIIRTLCGSAREHSRSQTLTEINQPPSAKGIWHQIKDTKPWSYELLAGHFHHPISCEEVIGDKNIKITILAETSRKRQVTATWVDGRLQVHNQEA